jgi:hypothetical protein
LLTLDDFTKISLKDKKLFDDHYSKYPVKHSENLFTTLVSWSHYVECKHAFIDDNIVLMTRCDGKKTFRPPFGREDPQLLSRIIELAKEMGCTSPLVGMEENMKEMVSRHYPSFKFIPNKDYFDYVYLATDLVNLPGKKYVKIRNHLNKFNRNHEYTLERVSGENHAEILEFLNRWCLWKDCESDPILDNERIAIVYCMENYFDLGLDSLAMRINGEIEALSVFESVTTDMAVIHFEKAMPDFDGIYQAINKESASVIAENHEYINRQSDLGIKGLREAKKRYGPHHMEKIYYTLRENL